MQTTQPHQPNTNPTTTNTATSTTNTKKRQPPAPPHFANPSLLCFFNCLAGFDKAAIDARDKP